MTEQIGELVAEGLESHRVETSCGSIVHAYFRKPSSTASDKPILVLIHGYPQTSYMWRKVLKLIPIDQPVFIPDIPGYGPSTPSTTDHSKRTTGHAILQTLRHLLPPPTSAPQAIILAGHDRGARICHRLTVDFTHPPPSSEDEPYTALLKSFTLSGTANLDTVPEITQYASFSNPINSVSTFHWPFLANPSLAVPILSAYGGGKWALDMISRWGGKTDSSVAALSSDGALKVYSHHNDKEYVIKATCECYAAGAGVDWQRQFEDQKAGRKIGGRLLVIYSEGYLGSRYDVGKVWAEWVADGVEVKAVGIGGGVGHFVAEENAEAVVKELMTFVEG